jgi:hypothetical protein
MVALRLMGLPGGGPGSVMWRFVIRVVTLDKALLTVLESSREAFGWFFSRVASKDGPSSGSLDISEAMFDDPSSSTRSLVFSKSMLCGRRMPSSFRNHDMVRRIFVDSKNLSNPELHQQIGHQVQCCIHIVAGNKVSGVGCSITSDPWCRPESGGRENSIHKGTAIRQY